MYINKFCAYILFVLLIYCSLCCPIRRAPGITWTYGYTGDERLLETDYEEILYETQSKWQNIKIARSREFGNVLLLDDDISKYRVTKIPANV